MRKEISLGKLREEEKEVVVVMRQLRVVQSSLVSE